MNGSDNASSRPFGAVGTAMVTPFTEDGAALDLGAAQELAVHLVERGTDLLVLSGTTGESPTTSDQEKIDLVRAVREAVGPTVQILAGVGSNDTRHSVDLARAHASLGIDGLLVVTPYYSKPSQEGVIAHVQQVTAATDLPVMLYDIPGRTGTALARETILRLAEDEKIRAVKDAKGDLLEAALIMGQADVSYYSGEDALNLPWLALGAAGVVSVVGQVAPELEAALVRATDEGDLALAQHLNLRLAPVVEAVMTRLPGLVAAKTALTLQGVLSHAAVRGPLTPASEEQTRLLADVLRTADGLPALAR
jgi:4-hydroxy-tetrahydrodipicolinate synthase